MRGLVVICLLASTPVALAEDQAECGIRLDAKMKEVAALTSAQAGQATYTKLFERAQQCIQEGKCGKADAFIAISEMMVDEKVIEIQRKKIAVLKAFFIEARPYENDACALLERFPAVINQITALNEEQLGRFIQISEKQFP